MRTTCLFPIGTLLIVIAVHGCGNGDNGDDCRPNAGTICKQGEVFWVDSCGNEGDKAGDCDCGCNADFTGCKEPCDCVPSCSGKECGPNGCGGTCPPGCGAGETCNVSTGQCEGCTPTCSGRECGSDGCGGTCPPGCGASETCNESTGQCEQCTPSCFGKECGPDGCGGTCPPGCGAGETCNEATGQCEGCTPSCSGRECGPDGCGGTCPPGCSAGESCSVDGLCVQSECGGQPLTIQGELLTNVANVPFDSATVSIQHKRDIDEYEDGCITYIDINLFYSSGCTLHVSAGEQYSSPTGLAIQSIEFSADSFCPNFPDATEGTYENSGGLVVAEIAPGVTEVPGYNVAESCVATTLTVKLEGTLNRSADPLDLDISYTEIIISGEFVSAGSASSSCPCVPNCSGKQCGDDGCGGSCGTCTGATEYCTSSGLCADDCAGRECGTSPRGFNCGNCLGATEFCNPSGQCMDDCSGIQCGSSPRGFDCGDCPGATEFCDMNGQCVDDCSGRQCGSSPNYGFDCGTCPGATDWCNQSGLCVDDCASVDCGPSPNAGHDCGNCVVGLCISGSCVDNLVSIQGGTFNMGSDTGHINERPVHLVTVSSFELMRTEVPVDLYRQCVDAGYCTTPDTGTRCNWDVAGRNSHPVNCVDWHQASTFCEWVGGRLPSEAEWEFAARSGGLDIAFPWGEQSATCQYAVMLDWLEGGPGCGQYSTSPTCSKTSGNTTQGLCDMAGNLFEWAQDWYHSNYNGAPTDGSAWELPVGTDRVTHGGSWNDGEDYIRASFRGHEQPTIRNEYIGFRCAR